jgi:dUTP pyrophosphatase
MTTLSRIPYTGDSRFVEVADPDGASAWRIIPRLKVKKLVPDAVLPSRAKAGDAGYDIVAIDDGVWSDDRTYIQYRTGIAIELPPGFHTELFPRSSVSKTDLVLANSIGLVDNGYRGEMLVRFKYVPRSAGSMYSQVVVREHVNPSLFKKGDRIAQLVIRRTEIAYVEEVADLSDTERGAGGFGSTGAK